MYIATQFSVQHYQHICVKYFSPPRRNNTRPWYVCSTTYFAFLVSLHYQKKSESEVAQSCLTLCNPMDHTVHGILQARMPELTTFPFSRGVFPSRDRTQVSHILYHHYQKGGAVDAFAVTFFFSPLISPLTDAETLLSLILHISIDLWKSNFQNLF